MSSFEMRAERFARVESPHVKGYLKFLSIESNTGSQQIGGVPGKTPILRWAGSKKKLLPHLQAATPTSFKTYIEPFVGSGVLFLLLQPKAAILSDLNTDLIEAYESMRSRPKRVWDLLMSWPSSEEFYYELRSCQPNTLNKHTRAARFIYLNRYCFNGVYRTNQEGGFNVSRGKGNLGIPEWGIFREFAARIKSIDLQNCDFESTVNRAKKNDFVYLDPPYAELGKRDRGEYGPGTFRPIDVSRLLKAMLRADKRGAKILLSYSADQIDLDMLKGWYVHDIMVMRNVSGFTGSRRRAREILISNYEWNDT
jgi:DNA adenine methylase